MGEPKNHNKGDRYTLTKIGNVAKEHRGILNGHLANRTEGGRDGRVQLRELSGAPLIFARINRVLPRRRRAHKIRYRERALFQGGAARNCGIIPPRAKSSPARTCLRGRAYFRVYKLDRARVKAPRIIFYLVAVLPIYGTANFRCVAEKEGGLSPRLLLPNFSKRWNSHLQAIRM